MKKRLLSSLLSLAMVLTLLPVSALAAEGETTVALITEDTTELTSGEYSLENDVTLKNT